MTCTRRPSDVYDALVIGGGPAGATCSLVMARAGLRVLLLEKTPFPRFHIGESFLPANYTLLCDLGLAEDLAQVPHVPKYGAEFAMGDAGWEGAPQPSLFWFDHTLAGRHSRTFNVERCLFDGMLLEKSAAAGVEILQGHTVRAILQLSDGLVRVDSTAGELRARWLIDASGQATVVGRHLGTRRRIDEPCLQKVAYFAHFDGVFRHSGPHVGHPTIAMCQEGWFWIIPLNATKTSVGLVLSPEAARQVGLPAAHMLRWGLERCPFMRERMKQASGPDTNHVAADFTYTCAPHAGAGYFLIGDAAVFLDPVFSTGAHLGMAGGTVAGGLVSDLVRGRIRPAAARRRYRRFVRGISRPFFRMIRHFYDHSFRELFLHGRGPFRVHQAVLAVLAGHACPPIPWALRWRMLLFELHIKLQRCTALVPRRRPFSLLSFDTGHLEDYSPA